VVAVVVVVLLICWWCVAGPFQSHEDRMKSSGERMAAGYSRCPLWAVGARRRTAGSRWRRSVSYFPVVNYGNRDWRDPMLGIRRGL